MRTLWLTMVTAKEFGDYELIEEIARGGMGVVYKARHKKLNRLTALKMILGGKFSSHEEIQRFYVEAEAAANLDHPSIVPVFEIGEHDGQSYFAMKLIEGGALSQQVDYFRTRPKEIARLVRQVADAVHHAHQRGVLHRDLKPANILLDEDRHPLVTDLGLAKSTSTGSDLTHTGALIGTPSYMAPEQAAGKEATTSVDIYALGAILYELLTGRAPYQGTSPVNTVMMVLESEPQPPSKVASSVERDLELICLKCMARQPEDRYGTAKELADDLSSWLAGEPITVRPPSWLAKISLWYRHNRRIAFALFALLGGLVVTTPLAVTTFGQSRFDIYSKFSGDKPWFYSFIDQPPWVMSVLFSLLLIAIWPMIGYLTNAITKPSSLGQSVKTSAGVSALLGAAFFALFGWFMFIQGAANSSRDPVRILAEAVWTPGEMSGAETLGRANEIFSGVELIPEGERADAVARRIEADLFQYAPTSYSIIFMVVFVFTVPIVYGTVFAYWLDRQAMWRWAHALRYMLAWWSSTFALGAIWMSWITGNGWAPTALLEHPIWYGTVFFSGALVTFLLLRDWRFESNQASPSVGSAGVESS